MCTPDNDMSTCLGLYYLNKVCISVVSLQGTGQTVLKHLRAEGVVRNRHIRHKELLILIQELWSGYRELDEKVDSTEL